MVLASSDYLKPFSIVVVEPTPLLSNVIKSVLQLFGARNLIDAISGRDALGIVQAKPVDLVLSEWRLPDTTGVELVRAIRALHNDMRYTPVVMVTSETRRSQVLQARNVGVNEYVAKPFTGKSLLTRVREVIERPRPFVQIKNYFGPDRRRRVESLDDGQDRRGSSPSQDRSMDAKAAPGDLALSQDQIDRIIAGDSIKDTLGVRKKD